MLDHVGVVGRDLAAMRTAYARLGFAPTAPRPLERVDAATGARVPLGQSSCHLVLERGYVELSAVETDDPRHHLAAYLSRYTGLHIVALASTDIAGDHARCVTAGVEPTAVAAAARDIEYGDLHGVARFQWFMLAPRHSPACLTCFVRNLTPDLVFQRAVQVHPNSARALVSYTQVDPDPLGAAHRLAALAGSPLQKGDGDCTVMLGRGRAHLLRPDAWARRYPGVMPPSPPSVGAFGIEVADGEALRRCLAASGTAYHEDGDRLWVPPESAAGSVVEFLLPRG